MAKNQIEIGDVVQIDPAHDPRFGACFMVVTEVRGWGLIGYFTIPGEQGQAFYRVPHGKYLFIGKAEWAIEREADHAQD